jgi:DNA-binding NarL/FixJ family response regulator
VTELPALNGPTRIRVLVADDHPVVRLGLSALLATEPDLELVAEAEQGEEAVARFRERRVTVALARGLIDLHSRHSPSG